MTRVLRDFTLSLRCSRGFPRPSRILHGVN